MAVPLNMFALIQAMQMEHVVVVLILPNALQIQQNVLLFPLNTMVMCALLELFVYHHLPHFYPIVNLKWHVQLYAQEMRLTVTLELMKKDVL